MKWILVAIVLGVGVSGAAAQVVNQKDDAFVRDYLARQLKDVPSLPPDEDQPDIVDKMNEIDATHDQPCGICDPITPSTPDGTYTLPPQNRR